MERLLLSVAVYAVIIVSLLMQVGCMSSTGWRFEVGVSPVKQLNNQAGLTQTTKASEDRRY